MSKNESHAEDLLPRHKRGRKRPSEDRGLPADGDLRQLAAAYLDTQAELWPKLLKQGLIPQKTASSLDEMVASHKERHRTRMLDVKAILLRLAAIVKFLAAIYCRFSSDKSSATSIEDQMVKALRKARAEKRFVPWEFIFTDYAVSGMDSNRRGYLNCKSLLLHKDNVIQTVFIDDFSRASRDSLEWWRLAAVCKNSKKRLVGASDGFDLGSEQYEIWITIYGLLSRLYIRSSKQKSHRGMTGTAGRGGVLGKLPMGFTRQIIRDEQGNIVRRKSGKPLHRRVIDPISKKYVRLLFKLFLFRRWSAYRIAKHFNQLKIDGTDTWTESAIKKMLINPAYVGVFVWNRYRSQLNPETGKPERIRNPRSEWVIYRDRSLAIISREWRKATLARLGEMKRGPRTQPQTSRNKVSATTLFSGTLQCGYCERELLLNRSAGKYKAMSCMNGVVGTHGCELCTSKSTRIIEECLLKFLAERLLTEAAIDELVTKANAHLKMWSEKPRVNVAPLRSRIVTLERGIDKLVRRVEGLTDEEEGLRTGYERGILQRQKEVNDLKSELRAGEQANSPTPPLLSKCRLISYLPDLPGQSSVNSHKNRQSAVQRQVRSSRRVCVCRECSL